jgi:hypothetical protein
MYKQWLKKKSTHRGRITFAWIWGLTGITFARRKSITIYVHIVNAELIESTLKQTIMCLYFDDFFMALEI